MPTEEPSAMMPELKVKSYWFYNAERGKVKLNWFLYEYACVLYDHIRDSRKKAIGRWRSKRSSEQIAEFCAYYAKRVRLSVNYWLVGATKEAEFEDTYASDYCHTNTQRENDAIFEVAVDAWAELQESCSACPCRCLSERYESCSFFDRMGQA